MNVLVIPDPQLTRAWPGHEDAPELVAVPLAEALTRAWQSDAHFAAYRAPSRRRRLSGADPQGRALWTLGEIPRMALLVVDVDHEETHAENKRRKAAGQSPLAVPNDWRVAERAKVDELRAAHPGVVMYETRGGYRIVARLAEDHEIRDAASKAAWRAWYLRQLGYLSHAFGIVGDPACDDWTRVYRLPRATRGGGRPEDHPIVGDCDTIGMWSRDENDDARTADVDEIQRLAALNPEHKRWPAAARIVAPAAPAARSPRAPRSRRVDTTVTPLVPTGPLAAALVAKVDALPRRTGARHNARLAIVATLRHRGWPVAALERLVHEMAVPLGKDPRALVAELVPSTVSRVDCDAPVIAGGYLRDHAPEVWSVIHDHLEGVDHAAAVQRRLHARGTPTLVTREMAVSRLRAIYALAREHHELVQIQATAGTGKTYTLAEDAAARARDGLRTAIAAPTHAVAREILEALRARGVAAHHLVSVASHEVDGARTCVHERAARALGDGGVSTLAVLCDGRGYGERRAGQHHLPVVDAPRRDAPCEHRDGCAAYAQARAEIPGDAMVVVGVHQHARRLHQWLRAGGPGGLLAVDEAPLLVDTARWSGAELLALAVLVDEGRAVVASERWRAEMLAAAAHGLPRAAEGATMHEILRAGLEAQGLHEDAARTRVAGWTHTIIDTARAHHTFTPRPSLSSWQAAHRGRVDVLEDRARAMRACALLGRALAHEAGHEDRTIVSIAPRDWGTDAGVPELRVGAVVEALAGALCDPEIGRVLLDATGDPTLVERYTGRVRVERIDVADPCEVERIFIPWSRGTRRHILTPSKRVRWADCAASIVEALAVATERCTRGATVAVLGYQAVVDELRRAWDRPEDAHPGALRVLAVLRDRGLTPAWGYYGALRGRNDWAGCAALVALGTPYPPVAEIHQLAEAHGMPHAVADLVTRAARNELEQAVARALRGQRSAPLRVVVLATVEPLRADARWTVRALALGRPPKVDAPELVTLAARLGVDAAAAAAGVSTRTVRRATAPLPPPSVTEPVTERGDGIGGSVEHSVREGGGTPLPTGALHCGGCVHTRPHASAYPSSSTRWWSGGPPRAVRRGTG